MRQEFSNQVAIITKSEHTSSIMFDGQPVTKQTQWSKASNWGYSYAAFPVTHGIHYITVTKDSRATFSAYVYGHSIVDTSSGAYGYTVGFQGISISLFSSFVSLSRPIADEFVVRRV